MSIQPIYSIPISPSRKPVGFWKFPYSFSSLIRFIINYFTNGFFSYINPDKMNLLNQHGSIKLNDGPLKNGRSIKIIFLGDIMMSSSGTAPNIDPDLIDSADVIIANVESPIIPEETSGRGFLDTRFEMPISFLETIHNCNKKAKWIFNIANNHACDTSNHSTEDILGIHRTIDTIRSHIPDAEVIGSDIHPAKSVLNLQIENGPNIGVVGWTDIMNNDPLHYKKPIVRGEDITPEIAQAVKSGCNFLIGFPHGNEEQSYHPIKETRDRWTKLMGSDRFDLIVGHGPHVVHPAEKINERLLFHSIGNFCSPKGRSQTKMGCIPSFTITYNEDKVAQVDYEINFLKQSKYAISFLSLKSGNSILTRLKSIWNEISFT